MKVWSGVTEKEQCNAKAQVAEFHQLPPSLFCYMIVWLVVRVLDQICPRDCHQPHLDWKGGHKRKGGEHPLWNEPNLQLGMVTKLQKRADIYFFKFRDQTVSAMVWAG